MSSSSPSSCSSSTTYAVLSEQILLPKTYTIPKPRPGTNPGQNNNLIPRNVNGSSSSVTLGPSKVSTDIKCTQNESSAEDLQSFSICSGAGSKINVKTSQTQLEQLSLSSLRQESQKLLRPDNRGDGVKTPTIFDLNLEDRKKIAKLIVKLAETQEQLEILKVPGRLRGEDDKQILDEHQNLGNKNTKDILQQNQFLTVKITHLQQQNSALAKQTETLEKKLNRSVKDNERLKWILRTIQQREEILLHNNRCLNAELEKNFSPVQSALDNIETLKLATGVSTELPQPLLISETTQTESCNFSPKSNEVKSQHFLQSGDFHQVHLANPHFVIPSSNSPVILKIPKVDSATGSNHFFEHFRGHNYRNPSDSINGKNLPKQEPDEDDILRELFFNF